MTLHFNPTLVLNADYAPLSHFPLSVISWQDAIRGVMQDKYDVVAEYDEIVRSPTVEMFVPSVVALRQYQKVTQKVAFTRINVFLRDRFRCQYCNERFNARELTFEHVVPRARGGDTSWENIVAACAPCNVMKGSATVMKPLTTPRKPTVGELRAAALEFPPTYVNKDWLAHLYWNVPLDP